MKETEIPFSASVIRLLRRPRRLLVTIIAGNESINVVIAALTTSVFIYIFGTEGKWMAIAATTVTLIVFCEAIPKTFAVTHPIRFSSAVALPLALFSKLLFPVVWSLEKISDIFVSVFGKDTPAGERALTEDKFKALVDAGHREGALEESQKDLIHRVFELADTKVSDIMIPRVDMFCLPLSMNILEVELEIIKTRISRITRLWNRQRRHPGNSARKTPADRSRGGTRGGRTGSSSSKSPTLSLWKRGWTRCSETSR